MREVLQPPSFFEALGVRYVGPVDGHDIAELEHALRNAVELSGEGPIVVHVLTQKGRGYPPAEDDDEKHLHDAPVFDPLVGPPKAVPTGYTQAFAEAIIKEAEADPRLVAITAAMPGPTGLLPFQARFPDRFFDVGIAEQHAVTGAAGMAMGGLRPVVAIYSTFLNRAWDQVVYDVALHRLPVVFCLDRAGITGPDGASHHGVYDMALLSKVPGHARARPVERPGAAPDAARRDEPRRRRAGRHPLPARPGARRSPSTRSASGCTARRVRATGDAVDDACACSPSASCVAAAEKAADALAADGHRRHACGTCAAAPRSTTAMLADAGRHRAVVTCEDGVRDGGIGMTIADRARRHRPGDASSTCSGMPTRFIPHDGRARAASSPGSASTPTASPPPSAACRSGADPLGAIRLGTEIAPRVRDDRARRAGSSLAAELELALELADAADAITLPPFVDRDVRRRVEGRPHRGHRARPGRRGGDRRAPGRGPAAPRPARRGARTVG